MDKSLEDREARKGGENELAGSRQAMRMKRVEKRPAKKAQREQKR